MTLIKSRCFGTKVNKGPSGEQIRKARLQRHDRVLGFWIECWVFGQFQVILNEIQGEQGSGETVELGMTSLPGILFKAEGVGAEKVDLSTQDESCSNSASNYEMKNMSVIDFK